VYRKRGFRPAALAVAAILVSSLFASTALGADYLSPDKIVAAGANILAWTGQGADGGVLNTNLCDAGNTPDGSEDTPYLHWIFNTDGGSATATPGTTPQLHLSGSLSGVFDYSADTGGAFHFFTPYITPDNNLLAYVDFNTLTTGGGTWGLKISHGCDGGGTTTETPDDLLVTKTAEASYTRTYDWTIAKSVDKTLVEQFGGTATFNYTVVATQTGFTDSDWAVSGTITVANPNDIDITTDDVADAIDNGGTCTVTGGTGAVIPANDDVDFPYSCTYASAPSPAAFTNEATATWDETLYETPTGSASGSASEAFGDPTTIVNDTVTVTDTFNGGDPVVLGTITETTTFSYSQTVNVPTWNCVFYENTATIVETGQSASKTVEVCGPAKTGALTIGFWQNKNGQTIIKLGSATAGVCDSGAFLRTYLPFEDLSATATCAQVATFVFNVIKAANASGASMNAMLKAQMLATALDVYFSTSGLGSVAIDLTMICTDLTCTAFEDSSSVFGGTPKTVLAMLAYAAGQSNSGGTSWYGQVKFTQELAKDAFDAINNQKAFAP
jgi:hypothetical protein